MRRIITLVTLSLSLLGGGAAMAANRGDRTEHARVEAHDRGRDRDQRPEPRFERRDERGGDRRFGGERNRKDREWNRRSGSYGRGRAR